MIKWLLFAAILTSCSGSDSGSEEGGSSQNSPTQNSPTKKYSNHCGEPCEARGTCPSGWVWEKNFSRGWICTKPNGVVDYHGKDCVKCSRTERTFLLKLIQDGLTTHEDINAIYDEGGEKLLQEALRKNDLI